MATYQATFSASLWKQLAFKITNQIGLHEGTGGSMALKEKTAAILFFWWSPDEEWLQIQWVQTEGSCHFLGLVALVNGPTFKKGLEPAVWSLCNSSPVVGVLPHKLFFAQVAHMQKEGDLREAPFGLVWLKRVGVKGRKASLLDILIKLWPFSENGIILTEFYFSFALPFFLRFLLSYSNFLEMLKAIPPSHHPNREEYKKKVSPTFVPRLIAQGQNGDMKVESTEPDQRDKSRNRESTFKSISFPLMFSP